MNGFQKGRVKKTQFEIEIQKYINEAYDKLKDQFAGTREAVIEISKEKVKEFMKIADRGLSEEDRRILGLIISISMFQSFCLGYGLGKTEEKSLGKIFL